MKKTNLVLALSLIFSPTLHSEMYYIINLKGKTGNGIVINNNGQGEGSGNSTIVEPEAHQEWVDFLNNQCGFSYTDINHLQADTETSYIDCYNEGITAMPSGTGLPNNIGYFGFNFNNIETITGLSNVQTAIAINLGYNTNLTSINGFQNLTSINDYLYLDNTALSNLQGLENLTSIGGDLGLTNMPNLTDISALSNLSNLGGVNSYSGYLSIRYNNSLNNLNGLQGITQILGGDIRDNDNLTSLEGLNNLEVITNALSLEYNPSLVDISALSNVTSVGYNIRFNKLGFTTKLAEDSWLCNAGFDKLNYTGSSGGSGGGGLTPFQLTLEPALSPSEEFTKSSVCEETPFEGSGDPQWVEWYDFLSVCGDEYPINGKTPSQMYTDPDQTEYHIRNSGVVCYGQAGAVPTTAMGINTFHVFRMENLGLNSLPNFQGVNSINDSFIAANNNISDISTLSDLNSVQGNLDLSMNNISDLTPLSNLVNVDGALNLTGNNISSVANLNSSLVIDGALVLSSNNFTDSSSFANLEDTNVRDISLSANPLTDTEGFSGYSFFRHLNLGNTNITNVDGLRNVNYVTGMLTLDFVSSLTNIDGLSNLSSVEQLTITRSQITNVNGLSNLSNAQSVSITDNDNLSDISGLSSLSSYVTLTLSNNGAISSLSSLSNLSYMG